jgi:hypothetical protein
MQQVRCYGRGLGNRDQPVFTGRRAGLRLSRPGLLILGYVLLTVAWLVATPAFNGPDEREHYTRALGLAYGHLIGTRVPFTASSVPPGANFEQYAWAYHDTRRIDFPLGAPVASQCVRIPSGRNALCRQSTYVGNYPPLYYGLSGLAARSASNPDSGDRRARAVSAALNLVLIATIVLLLWDGGAASLLGPALALTPMAVYLGAMLNPNGTEILAAGAVTAAVLRISRDPLVRAPRIWAGLVVLGCLDVVLRQLGPVWALTSGWLMMVLVLARGQLRAFVKVQRSAIAITICALAIAGVLYEVWALYGHTSHPTSFSPFPESLRSGISVLGFALRTGVGQFDLVPIPHLAYAAWLLGILLLVGGALRFGRTSDRWVLLSTLAVAVGGTVTFYAGVYRLSGFPMGGRYVLPLFMVVPLVAGEQVARSATRLAVGAVRLLTATAGLAIALAQLVSWWSVAAHSTRTGQNMFAPAEIGSWLSTKAWALPAGMGWSPPLGWLPWIVSASAGAVMVFLAIRPASMPRILPSQS